MVEEEALVLEAVKDLSLRHWETSGRDMLVSEGFHYFDELKWNLARRAKVMNLRPPPCLQWGWTSREVWPRWVWSLVNSLNLRVYPWIRYDHGCYGY